MSNILITGGNGFLGSRIVEELQKENNCKPISRKNNVDIKFAIYQEFTLT